MFIAVLLVFAIYFMYVIFLGSVIWRGLRTGKIAHSDTRQFADRQKNPLFYWFLVLLFTVMIFIPPLAGFIWLVRGIAAVEFSGG